MRAAVSHRVTHTHKYIQSKWKIQTALRGKKELNRRLCLGLWFALMTRCECVTFSLVDSYNGTCRQAAARSLIETRIALSRSIPGRGSLCRAHTEPNPTAFVCVYIFISRNNFQGQNTQVMFRAHSYLPCEARMRGPFLKK